MFYWYFNSTRLHGPFAEFGDLAEHVVETTEDTDVFQQRVTPDLLVARFGWDMPITECPSDDVVRDLLGSVYDLAPIEEWARESVHAEREACMRRDSSDSQAASEGFAESQGDSKKGDPWGPDDNDPRDSDRHNEQLTQWQNRRVNYEAFDAIDAELIIDQCYTSTLGDLEQRIKELWESGFGIDEDTEE